jgi:hypothetical protein
VVAFSILIVSVIVTSPINISRQVTTYEFKLNETNTSLTLHTYDLSRFSDSKVFVVSVYLANFLRDILPTAIEIVFNVFLVYFLKKRHYDRIRLTGRRDIALSNVEKTNVIITIIISFLSILLHIVTFLVKLTRFYFVYSAVI